MKTVDVALMLYPNCQMASVHGLEDLFSVANQYASDHGGAVRIRSYQWSLDMGEEERPAYVIVPGRLTPPMERDEARDIAAWLRDCHGNGATIASVCVGAFILGHSGLLDGRRATTHWYYSETFKAAFPETQLAPGDILIEDGDIITAAGMMAWTDLGLRLVHRILGPTVMADTAKFLLVDPAGREQRHYSRFAPNLTHGDKAILKVQHWLQGRAGKEVSVEAMSAEAGLETRTFLRRFQKATGVRPTEYVQDLRVALAREKLEFSRDTVEQIAWDVGYKDPAAFRRVFQRITGLGVGAYRERFNANAALGNLA
ncbi:AraC family transcriptional regulator [Devosia riboflavina]|uniref:AraC family transcriptional regulator n=1 Tax=Devosia riboflavina TaxID=46914 RepID=A0A087LX49_9HYPH|nr:GlxA family transcriptional regulator [Devosia riboflavina]KFL29202.1 AraC family transcriptional regulator [Devosia riboflavina]